MAQELVWARVGDVNTAVSRSYAEAHKLEVLDESPYTDTGDVRRPTRANGRPAKKKTSVADSAAAKKAAEVIAPGSASDNQSEENPR